MDWRVSANMKIHGIVRLLDICYLRVSWPDLFKLSNFINKSMFLPKSDLLYCISSKKL
jgi:hypothetical protein